MLHHDGLIADLSARLREPGARRSPTPWSINGPHRGTSLPWRIEDKDGRLVARCASRDDADAIVTALHAVLLIERDH